MTDKTESAMGAMKKALAFSIGQAILTNFPTAIIGMNAIKNHLQNDRNLVILCHLSGLSSQEVAEKVQAGPWSLEDNVKYYQRFGRFLGD